MQEANNVVSKAYTVSEWFEGREIYNGKKASPATESTHISLFRTNIRPFIGMKKMNNVTFVELRDILLRMDNSNYSFSKIYGAYALLSKIFRTAYENGIIEHNPCNGLHRFLRETKGFPEPSGHNNEPLNNSGKQKRIINIKQIFNETEVGIIDESLKRLPLGNLFGFCFHSGIDARAALSIVPENISGNIVSIDLKLQNKHSNLWPSPIVETELIELSSKAMTYLPNTSTPSIPIFASEGGHIPNKNEISLNSFMLQRLTGIKNAKLCYLSRDYRLKHRR